MLKLLKSAVANAEHNNGMDVENLYVSTVVANPGPTLKGHAPGKGQLQSDSQENHSHHHWCEREGLSRR